MGRPSRRLVVCAGVLVALVALARRTAQRGGERHRRLWHASPRHSVPATALAPDHLRRWVAPRRAAQAWNVTTHGRTTGYRSAANELAWLDGARRGKICATAELPEVEAAAQVWTGYAKRAWRPGGKIAPTPTPEERRALSHFRVEPARSAAFVEPIEPLHGIARHPFARVGCPHSVAHPHDVDLFDVTYLVIHNACGRPKPRVLLFDLGASVGFKGVPGGIYAAMPAQGGGLAPSLPLLYRVYADRCLEPDAVFAWEPAPRDARGRWGEERDWWGQLPPDKRARVRFYHDMVDEGQLPATDHPANSFLGVLEAAAVPDDFVAVKVDIDTMGVELTIVEALAERPELAALVDELFFEYHFHFDGMNFGWNEPGPGAVNYEVPGSDVDTAVGLMYRLRTLGVRAHFWI